jgi:hypothetical protein
MAPVDPTPQSSRSDDAKWIGLAVVGLGVAVVFLSLWLGARGTEPEDVGAFLEDDVDAATDAASDVITAITTYDPETIADVREQLLGLSTGEFRTDYEELLEGGLGDVLEEEAIRSSGEIVDGPSVGFTSATEGIAVARVVQEVTSRGSPGGRTVFLVVQLDLEKVDDSWKAASLRILSQQVV